MPFENTAPLFGLLSAFDARPFSGVELFSRSGGSAVSMQTFNQGEGVYEDLLFFLNGRVCHQSVVATGQINTTANFGNDWTVTLNSDDKVVVSSDVDFTLDYIGSVDALGFGSSQLNATLSGSDYVVTAPNNWTRGSVNLDDVLYRVREVGGAGDFNFPAIDIYMQDITVFLRNRQAINDADNVGENDLTKLDATAQNNISITWFLDDNGHVNCSYLSSIGDISWSSSAFRDLLGFTGGETPVVYSTVYSLITATHKPVGVLIPSRPYQSHHLRVQNESQSRRLIGGGYTSNFIGSYITSILSFDLDALLDQVDDYRHFTNRWMPYCSAGERVNIYLGWGDSRRALLTAQVTADQPAYDLLFTSEDNGEYGRVRGSLTINTLDLSYPTRLKRRVPVTIEVEHL
jgi:hypothetical protein